MKNGLIDNLLKPVDSLFSGYSALLVDDEKKARCLTGTNFTVDSPDGLYRVYDSRSVFLMLGRVDGGIMHTIKSFFDVS